jgi:hypothetical protein
METSAAKAFIRTTLAASASLVTSLGGTAIYADVIPQGSASNAGSVLSKAIVYSVQSGDVEGNARGNAIAGVPILLVKCITQGNDVATGDAIMEIVKPLLEGVQGTVTGYYIKGCSRVGAVDYMEFEGGIAWRHLGALYRFAVVGTA